MWVTRNACMRIGGRGCAEERCGGSRVSVSVHDRRASSEATGNLSRVVHLTKEAQALPIVRQRIDGRVGASEATQCYERDSESPLVVDRPAQRHTLLERALRLVGLSGEVLRVREISEGECETDTRSVSPEA